jgi:DNA-binding IclR family transcriptional regulator
MAAVAVPVCHADGRPFAAVTVVALSTRMTPPRRDNIVASIKQEAAQIEAKLRGENRPVPRTASIEKL